MRWLGRWWARLVGAVARTLVRHPAPHAHRSHEGIDLVVAEYLAAAEVDAFFARTTDALVAVATLAPRGYAALRRDVARIILWHSSAPSAYHRFQQAALVPPDIAFEAETPSYAAWLLYVSALARGPQGALARADELLGALSSAERDQARELLSGLEARPRP